MGSRTDVAELLSQCRWSEEGSYLGEIAKSSGFPCVAKVSRGQYVGLGQPSFSNPSLVSHVLLVSAGKQLSVVAQCVKFKNARQRVIPFGPTLVIPQDFDGHFEILNEDGKAVPCIETVEGLARRFPDSCLVREAFKAYKPDAKSSMPIVLNSKDPDGLLQQGIVGGGGLQPHYRISDKTRLITPGEILVLVGEVSVPSGKNKVTRYLRCFDSKGQTVFLASGQKGKFSPLARQESISGVHTTKNILNKRMPLMVRLVDGKPPVMPSAKSSSFKFVPELRLYCTLQEELIFGMPLSQSSKEIMNIVPMPLTVPLKFQVCRNMSDVEISKEFSRVYEKVNTLVQHSKNFIQIYDINLKKELRFDGRQWKSYAPPIFLTPSLTAASTTDPEIIPITNNVNNNSCSSDNKLVDPSSDSSPNYNEIPDMQDYEDIDQIYDYVRGIKPPPARLLNNDSSPPTTDQHKSHHHHNNPHQNGNNNNKKLSLASSDNKMEKSKNYSNGDNNNKGAPTTVVTITSSGACDGGPDVIANVHCNSSNKNSLSNANNTNSTSNDSNRSNRNKNIAPPVPKHRNSSQVFQLRPTKSLEKLIDDDDRPPIPPPIETIPSLQNKFQILQNPNSGLSVSVTNNCSNKNIIQLANSNNYNSNKNSGYYLHHHQEKMTSKTQIVEASSSPSSPYDHHQGTQIQIQIRSSSTTSATTENNNNKKVAELKNNMKNNPYNNHSHSHAHQNGSSSNNNAVCISSSSGGTNNSNSSSSNNIIITTTNIGHGHHNNSNHSHIHKLDSTGGSISTSGTPTNTSGSGSSSQSKSSSSCNLLHEDKGRLVSSPTRPKTHLYVKHNSKESSSSSPIGISGSSGGGLNNLSIVKGPVLSTDTNGNGLSGSPSNKIIFRRSPIFDCRYKSMNDLNRSSLVDPSPPPPISSSNNPNSSQRLKYFQHNHHHVNSNSGNNSPYNNNKNALASSRDNYLNLGSSQTNLNLNLMNLNLNLKASAKRKGIFRPKSLTNIALDDGLSNGLVFGSSDKYIPNSGGGLCGGVKKKLADMVVPSHHHAIHTPPPPPIELLQKVPLKCSSQRNSRNIRKGSVHPNLFL